MFAAHAVCINISGLAIQPASRQVLLPSSRIIFQGIFCLHLETSVQILETRWDRGMGCQPRLSWALEGVNGEEGSHVHGQIAIIKAAQMTGAVIV